MRVVNILSGLHLCILALVLGVFSVFHAVAHPDLQLQIDLVTNQLVGDSDNTELLLRRGNLYRRHENWQLAREDFQHVRRIEPGNGEVDWFEGRMEVEAGQLQKGMALLDQFLEKHPDHAIALQNRAKGYLLTGQPLLAAQDYHAVIQVSQKPGPSLYGAGARAFIKAGSEYYPQAQAMIELGLDRFPGEVMLTGLATDIALAQADIDTAKALIHSLPEPILGLNQWQARLALLDCQAGREAQASQWFAAAAQKHGQTRGTTGHLSETWLQSLARQPGAQNCTRAALAVLQDQ